MFLGPVELRWIVRALVVLMSFVPHARAQATDKPGAAPRFTLRAGEAYFRVDGTPAFVLGRNPAGRNTATYLLIEVHPYAGGSGGGRLDELILTTVRQRRTTYHKPVLLGECGLDAAPPHGTLDTAARAAVGIQYAIWAALVSGAMNGRMLWWQDGYDQFESADLSRHYQDVAITAASFVRSVDFSGFATVPWESSERLFGAMLGNDRLRLGWFRDVRSIPPDWRQTTVTGAEVRVKVPGTSWQVEFVDPSTGGKTGPRVLTPHDERLRVELPPFQGDVAIRLERLSP